MSNRSNSKDIPLHWPFPAEKSIRGSIWSCSSAITLTSVALMSKVWLTKLNYTKIHRAENFHKAVERRSPETALVTVSNHHSCIDDPIISGCLRWRSIFRPFKFRWTLAAHDICFTKKWHGIFFGLGRCVPVVRGGGVYQRGVDYVLQKLNNGEWVHVFPEGRVNMEKTFIRLKWGVGRLVADCQRNVIVLPLYHIGMDDILPNQKPYIPQLKKQVTVLFGNPMEFDLNVKNWKNSGWSAEKIRKEITDTIQEELERLKLEAYKLHAES